MKFPSLFSRFTPIACSLVCVFALSACNEHENPLTKLPAKDVASWIYEHKTENILSCAQLEWSASQGNSNASSLCQTTAQELASSMKSSGFGNVLPQDILLGTIWTEFNQRVRANQANKYSAEKTHNIFDSIKTKKPAEKGNAP